MSESEKASLPGLGAKLPVLETSGGHGMTFLSLVGVLVPSRALHSVGKAMFCVFYNGVTVI